MCCCSCSACCWAWHGVMLAASGPYSAVSQRTGKLGPGAGRMQQPRCMAAHWHWPAGMPHPPDRICRNQRPNNRHLHLQQPGGEGQGGQRPNIQQLPGRRAALHTKGGQCRGIKPACWLRLSDALLLYSSQATGPSSKPSNVALLQSCAPAQQPLPGATLPAPALLQRSQWLGRAGQEPPQLPG